MGDIFKIAGCRSVCEQYGLNCRDLHTKWAGDEKRWQARWADLLVTHSNLQVPAPEAISGPIYEIVNENLCDAPISAMS